MKIEIEQLIISILDDPSVSRVMREAGFSSTQVKINVEKAVSLELCSQQPLPSISKTPGPTKASSDESSKNDDFTSSVIENMMNKRRKGIAIVGECVSNMEGVVKELMERVNRGEVPEGFREVKFISLPGLFSLGNLSREEVEKNLVELRCLVKSCVEKGVVLYLGDLKWTTENRIISSSCDIDDQGIRKLPYCPVEHMIVELGRLVCGFGESCERFWLMGIATFQTYRRCRSGSPSLEIVWGLHPLTIPEASLSLSLIPESDVQSISESKNCGNGSTWLMPESGNEKELSCGGDRCCNTFDTEARSFRTSSCTSEATASTLPSWLQEYKDQNSKRSSDDNDQECVRPAVKNLSRKWNSFSGSTLKQPFYPNDRTITFSSLSPSSSTTAFSYDLQNPSFHHTPRSWLAFEPNQYSTDHHFPTSERGLRIYIPDHKEPKQAFSTSNPNSTSSSDVVMETEGENFPRFKEWNSENLKTLCTALETKVPWQKDIIPEIASTILQCRSGMVRRKGRFIGSEAKEETWLFFQGVDADAKEKIARELSRLVFGSNDNLVLISLSSFSSTRADSTETNKRSRDEQSFSYIERFAEAVGKNPSRVFLVEDVEQADYRSQMGIKRAIERGRISDSNGKEVSLCDAIVILSCESFSSRSRAPSPPTKQNSDGSEVEEKEISPCVSLDLNISFDDDDESGDHNESIDDIGLLESVDRRVFFKIQEL